MMSAKSSSAVSITVVMVGLLAGLSGCGEPKADSRNDMSDQSDTRTAVDADSATSNDRRNALPDEAPPDDQVDADAGPVLVTVEDWTASIKADRAAAQSEYDGKSVQLTGRVVGFQFGYSGGFYEAVWLGHQEETKEAERQTVNCKGDFANVWEKLAPDSVVTLEGNVHVLSAPRFAELRDSKIVSVDGPAPIKLTAEKIVMDYADDSKKAQSNYYGKRLFVTGTVAQHEGDMGIFYGGSVDLLLAANQEQPFAIDHHSSLEEYFRGIETGDVVTIYGTFTKSRPSSDAEKEFGLHGAQPVAVVRNDKPLSYDPTSGWVQP